MTKAAHIHGLLALLILCGAQAVAQSPAVGNAPDQMSHFVKDGLSFDYPTGWKIEDLSTQNGQQLVLTNGGSGAQIMVISRFERIGSADQLATARHEVADTFIETMWQELQKIDPKVSRTTAQIEAAGAQATGVSLRAVLSNEPGRAEIYSLLINQRLVMISLIGSDKELDEAATAWATIRRTLQTQPVAAK
jgi:hypothetical protein